MRSIAAGPNCPVRASQKEAAECSLSGSKNTSCSPRKTISTDHRLHCRFARKQATTTRASRLDATDTPVLDKRSTQQPHGGPQRAERTQRGGRSLSTHRAGGRNRRHDPHNRAAHALHRRQIGTAPRQPASTPTIRAECETAHAPAALPRPTPQPPHPRAPARTCQSRGPHERAAPPTPERITL